MNFVMHVDSFEGIHLLGYGYFTAGSSCHGHRVSAFAFDGCLPRKYLKFQFLPSAL